MKLCFRTTVVAVVLLAGLAGGVDLAAEEQPLELLPAQEQMNDNA